MTFLQEVVGSTKRAVDQRQAALPLADLAARIQPRSGERHFLNAIRAPGLAVIAEFKRTSPSQDGPALKHAQVGPYVETYVRCGASALSILTEEKWFSGSLKDLREARLKVSRPLLRKDFVIDEYQVFEAADAGADAILLIAAVLRRDPELAHLHRLARDLGLDALVEVRNLQELERAIKIDADLIGVNNRNLETKPATPHAFEVDVERTRNLVEEIPSNVTIVSESGLKTRAQLDELVELGVDAALIGSAFMEASDLEAKCRELMGGAVEALKDAEKSDHPAFA